METKAQSLEKVLDNLKAVGGIELSAIVSRQGLLMVSKDSSGNHSNEAFAALTATLYMSAESTVLRLKEQKPKYIIVQTTEEKHLITYTAGNNALIVILVGKDGVIGLILNELKTVAENVKQII